MLANKKPTLLIVDDNRAVRDLIRLNLEAEGYEVFTAENGRDAIASVSVPERNIDILITDIIMPQMNGRELANRICALRPFIKVLFVSAYTAEVLTSHNLCPEGADFIKKPFTKEFLMARLGEVWATSPKWKDLVSKRA